MEEKTLLEYWYILYSRKWTIVVITLFAVLTTLVFSKILDPVYEAKSTFFVPQEPDKMTFFTAPNSSMARGPLSPQAKEEIQGPYIGILKSKAIAQLVQKDFPSKTVYALMHRDMDFVLSNEYIIEVYARDHDPKVAAGIANAYVKYFNQLMGGYSMPVQSQTGMAIEKEISYNQDKLAEAREALRIFQEENKIANIDEETKQLISQKTDFESQLEKTKIELKKNLDEISATKNELNKELRLSANTSEIVVSSPRLIKLNEQLAEIESKMSMLRVELKETHPVFVALKRDYDVVQNNISKELEKITKSQIKAPDSFGENLRRRLVDRYVEKAKIEASINANLAILSGVEDRIRKIPMLKNQLDNLAGEIPRYQGLLDALRLNLQEIEAQTKRILQVAVKVEEANPPARPSFPVLWLNILVATIAGFISGVWYCFLLDYIEESRGTRMFRLLHAIKVSDESKLLESFHVASHDVSLSHEVQGDKRGEKLLAPDDRKDSDARGETRGDHE